MNPWQFNTDQSYEDYLKKDLLEIAAFAKKQAGVILELSSDLEDFSKNITFLASNIFQTPTVFRSNRRFFAVQVFETKELIKEISNLSPTDRADFAHSVKSVLQYSSNIAQQVKEERKKEIQSEISFLAPSERGNDTESSSVNYITKFSEGALRRATTFSSQVLRRADGAKTLAANKIVATLDVGLHATQKTVSPHISAIQSLAKNSTSTLLDVVSTHILLTAIFPPAAPIAIVLAVLDNLDDYKKSHQLASDRIEEDYLVRQELRAERNQTAYNKLSGLSDVVSTQTEHIHITINKDLGTTDATVLSGPLVGKKLHNLPPHTVKLLSEYAPDPDTRTLIEKWAALSS